MGSSQELTTCLDLRFSWQASLCQISLLLIDIHAFIWTATHSARPLSLPASFQLRTNSKIWEAIGEVSRKFPLGGALNLPSPFPLFLSPSCCWEHGYNDCITATILWHWEDFEMEAEKAKEPGSLITGCAIPEPAALYLLCERGSQLLSCLLTNLRVLFSVSEGVCRHQLF